MSDSSSIAAIVLAAGQASRMGRPKQLLPVDGRPLLSRTLDVVRRSSLSPGILVLGAYAEKIQQQVDSSEFDVVINENFARGQSTSLVAGLSELPADCDGAFVFLADQPLIPPNLINRMLQAFKPGSQVAIRPRYANGPGNPILLSGSIFPELLQIQGDTGARKVLQQYRDQVLDVDATAWPVPLDVDTNDDYLQFLNNWASTGAPDTPRFCQRCASEITLTQRHGRLRPVCPVCDFTYFFDPKIAVGVIIEINGKLVMQRRKISPGLGKWTFPSGFVDRGEIVADAAIREVYEEVRLKVENLELLDLYSVNGETVTLVMYATACTGQTPVAGDESSDVGLFAYDNLPELAFARDAQIITDWRKRTVCH